VVKYKTKKRLAEAKLESAKVNLARVNDILVEIEKQLASLKRQASKARRFAELREQLRQLMRQVLGSKALELDAEAQRLADLLRTASETEQQENCALEALQQEQHNLSARLYTLETEIRQSHNLLGQTSLELDRAENRIVFNRERLRELEGRSAELAAAAAQAMQQTDQLRAKAAEHESSFAELQRVHDRLAAAVQELMARYEAHTQEISEGERLAEELRQLAAGFSEEAARLERDAVQADVSLAHHAENRARVEQAEARFRESLGELQAQLEAAEKAWQEADARARRLEQSVKNWQARIAGLKHEQQTMAQRYDRLREELAGLRARKSSLEQILRERSYTTDTVQKLFAANGNSNSDGGGRGFRAVGLLADYAEVQEPFETAVEQFLKDELQYVVVESFDTARAGIAMLREEVGGRATFFVDSLRKLNLPIVEREMPTFAEEGVLTRMDAVVQFRDPLGPAAVQFLPRLQTAFIVESTSAAERLASTYSQYQFVTTEGTCYHGRLVTGGRPGEAGPLAMKRELRLLESQIRDTEQQADEAQSMRQRVEEELQQCEASLADTITRHMEAEKAQFTAAHTRDALRAELAKTERQLAEYGSEILRLRREHQEAQERADTARRLREEALEARSDAEYRLSETTARVAAVRQEMQSLQEQLGSRRAELATLAERLAAAESIARRMADELAEAENRARALQGQHEALERERQALEAGSAEAERQLLGLAAKKERLMAHQAALEQEFDRARSRSVELEELLRTARQRMVELRDRRAQYEIERARNDSDRHHLRETCLSELNLHPEDLIAELQGTGGTILNGEELVAAEAGCRELKARIESMGAVNMMALEEYQECEQRYTFLARERDDLVQSIADTQQTIRELDEVTRSRFEEAFRTINQNFAECFRTLFGGGTGEMRLTQVEGDADPGVEIVAQPPGKRLQNVLLLSGGEKALTALALLIGIFRYQPSPFCILDEVDAPLDEANVGRFTRLISQMSDKTQFLIVTHNRRTMEMASVLYGVTMQEPGVSKLVSVRWEDSPQTSAA
jgi:chromosome segregation protein